MKTPYDKTLRYVLKCGPLYVANINPATMSNPLTADRNQAMLLDWRDNEQAKAQFFSAIIGAPVTAEKA